jgi:hypothetical protein
MCADECTAGDKCKLWDMKSGAFTALDPATSLHDRARDYSRVSIAIDRPEGQVMNANFVDTTYSAIHHYDGYHDAAIWTGTALAAEAWRLATTGAPDAADQVKSLVATLHRDFAITGAPGYLARTVITSTPLDNPTHCSDPEFHCGVSYGGATHDWLGATSRDQYTGVILGYVLAYEATTDPDVKKTIEGDLVTLATELMTQRASVPATIVVNKIPIQKDLSLENVVLVPSEMVGGRVYVNFDTSSAAETQMSGLREFFPDYSVIAKQVLGLNVPIPRPTSSIILGAIFRAAIVASAGDPASKTAHDAIAAYYAAHAPAWLDIAAQWKLDTACGKGYFANHLAVITAYVWASLEDSPSLRARIADDVFDGALWAGLHGHKNSYFAFLWGGTRATPDKTAIDAASAQLAQLGPAPRIHVGRSNVSVAKYMPHDTTCTSPVLCDTNTLAVDVGDRVVDDFIWQRQPWQLEDGGDALQVYPGIDFLAAYWAGRRHGFVTDDRQGTCLRHAP